MGDATNNTKRGTSRKEHDMAKEQKERAVVVTTDKRGVFFGYATATDGDPITLSRARMCVYWSADVRGVVGLAATGPTKGCRVTRAAPAIQLRGVTAVMDASPEASVAWEQEIWS